jgi:hypothetical protein
MAGIGGKMPGAGRPKGSTTRIKVLDYFTDEELKVFWSDLKEKAKTDTKVALYFAEQMTGKAMQPVEGNFEGTLSLTFDKTFNESSNPTS